MIYFTGSSVPRNGYSTGQKITEKLKNIYYTGILPLISKITEFTGYSLQITGAIPKKLINYKFYGNSTQDGTPTPSTPVSIESVGEKTKNMIPDTWTEGWIDYQGNWQTQYTDRYVTDFIEIDNTKSHTVSGLTKYSTITIWDENKTYIKGTNYGTGEKLTLSHTYVTSSAKYVRIAYPGSVNDKPIQLELGTSATSYEPYGYKLPIKVNDTESAVVYLDEPLRRAGNYVDYIDYSNQKVVRNVAELVLKGTENFNSLSNQRVYISTVGKASNIYVLSNQYKNANDGSENNCVYGRTNSNSVVFRDTTHITEGSVAEWKAYLASLYEAKTPVVFIYGLSTPSEKQIKIPDIKLVQGTNTIITDTTTSPSDAYAKAYTI